MAQPSPWEGDAKWPGDNAVKPWGHTQAEPAATTDQAQPAITVTDSATNEESAHGTEDATLAEKLGSVRLGEVVGPDEDKKKEAHEHGWTAPIPTDYNSLMNKEGLPSEGPLPSWMANTGTYEWKDEYGEVGPEDPELEKVIFGNRLLNNAGAYLKHLEDLDVHQEGEVQFEAIREFNNAGLHPIVVANLEKANYFRPTPIQDFCIPAILSKKDVMAVAQTGSGKTQAYLAPILSMLMGKAKKLSKPKPAMETYDPKTDAIAAEPLVVVLCPTRELAIQIWYEARKTCYRSMLRPLVLYGGAPRRNQIAELQRGCDVLIGTPGRVADLVKNCPQWLSLRRVKHTVIDEADEMVNEDWAQELDDIMYGAATNMSDDHQFMMFSATFPPAARQLAAKYLTGDHAQIHVGRLGSSHENIHQVIVWVESSMKYQALWDLLMGLPACRTIIFCASLNTCDRVDDFLTNNNVGCAVLSSSRTQREREQAIGGFRQGNQPILICPIAFGRGLDLPNCLHVIMFDLPRNIQEYVNCIGRTGRIGNRGQATSFYNERNTDIAPDLAKIMLECNHTVPDFLQDFVPADGVLNFEEPEVNAFGGIEGGETSGWGSGDAAGVTNGDGWGNGTAAAGETTAENGWGAPTVTTAADPKLAQNGFEDNSQAKESSW